MVHHRPGIRRSWLWSPSLCAPPFVSSHSAGAAGVMPAASQGRLDDAPEDLVDESQALKPLPQTRNVLLPAGVGKAEPFRRPETSDELQGDFGLQRQVRGTQGSVDCASAMPLPDHYPGNCIPDIRIGTAAWGIPKEHGAHFPVVGSHLERYSTVLNAVEINSSFYRPHRTATYERWAASVPEDFRFSVKVPKAITHERRLKDAGDLLDRFLSEAGALGPKLGPLLVQLPPSLSFQPGIADTFLSELRNRVEGGIVCEPRHASWFEPEVEALLDDLRIARVAADPAPVPGANEPGGWRGLSYYRLHGSPRIYYSAYSAEYLAAISDVLARDMAGGAETWCIFDNTAAFAATGDALTVKSLVQARTLTAHRR